MEIRQNSIRWVDHKQNPVNRSRGMTAVNDHLTQSFINDILSGSRTADIDLLTFPDPNNFLAGQLHEHYEQWLYISATVKHELAQDVLEWIKQGVTVEHFFRHFRGSYKGKNYDSARPPTRIFSNNPSCQQFSEFITSTLIDRLATGAISVWGRVGHVKPPHLVMPLTVEPSKPRLCNDNRFLNLWMVDRPFKLDRLTDLPRYVFPNSFQCVTDDKSGYDHILLTEESRPYFGFRWGHWYFVSNTIPFGWKLSAFIYHTTGSILSHYLRSLNIPCSLYIDDRHSGQLQLRYPSHSSLTNMQLASSAIFLVCYTATKLGYFLALNKCILIPRQQVPYLGFVSDSGKQAFTLIPKKKDKFLTLVRDILQRKFVDVVTLQRLVGKCISMSLAIPGARLFTNEMNSAISRGLRTSRPCQISDSLHREISHWLFLEDWNSFLPWISETHSHVTLFTDASAFAWAGVLSPNVVSTSISDYWPAPLKDMDIATKESLALANVLAAFSQTICNSRVDVFTDSMALIRSWEKQGSRSPSLFNALKQIFSHSFSFNIHLKLYFIPSSQNLADNPSRRLSPADSHLSLQYWRRLQVLFGAPHGHSVDLMAVPSNVQTNETGQPLPFFSPYPTPNCTGVNVFAQLPSLHPPSLFSNPYAFPPIVLIGQLLHFLIMYSIPCTLLIPDIFPRRYWWPILHANSKHAQKLAIRGDVDVMLTPSSSGYCMVPLPWDLWVFKL